MELSFQKVIEAMRKGASLYEGVREHYFLSRGGPHDKVRVCVIGAGVKGLEAMEGHLCSVSDVESTLDLYGYKIQEERGIEQARTISQWAIGRHDALYDETTNPQHVDARLKVADELEAWYERGVPLPELDQPLYIEEDKA